MPHRNAILTETRTSAPPSSSLTRAGPCGEPRNVSVSRSTPPAAGRSVTANRAWAGMVDKSSRPKHCPHQLSQRTERRIVGLRVTKRWGPARIAYHLHLNPRRSTRSSGATAAHPCDGPILLPEPGSKPHAPRNAATSTPPPATWSTSTSRNSDPRRRRPQSAGPCRGYRNRPEPPRTAGPGMPTSTTPSTTTPAWPTAKS